MALADHEAELSRRLARLERHFFFYYSDPNLRRYERWYRLEGLLSQTWQAWCQFCRAVFIESCIGTNAAGGRLIPRAQASWTSELRVSYEALCATRGNAPKVGQTLNSLRQELTWGDVTKLVNVIVAMAPNNSAELLAGFGAGLAGPQHLRIVRNASAHINAENIADVRRLMSFYFGASFQHPTDLSTWTEINSKSPAFITWLADMRTMAAASIQ